MYEKHKVTFKFACTQLIKFSYSLFLFSCCVLERCGLRRTSFVGVLYSVKITKLVLLNIL